MFKVYQHHYMKITFRMQNIVNLKEWEFTSLSLIKINKFPFKIQQ